ncbi:sugar O-acetyltransferase [uncultured Faecalibaculum sp.]|uniref:sugar O-acetyltransferase n=1 Tax=uncultured Faecalibaculum sp. TaxID=1729681 RepID=UPI00261C87D2|nr:sugar O-acetyltransferase [uncultured Faecalibaculum sp.]
MQEFTPGKAVKAGAPVMKLCSQLSQRALRLTMKLNSGYQVPAQVYRLFSTLTGQEVYDGFGLFPPFYTDCGINIHLGKDVFIYSGCRFQNQGEIWIGDGSLIGHNEVLATLNHGLKPGQRHELQAACVVIGNNVWLGVHPPG